jgi:uncharacterized phage protein (TIGR02218 family)
MKLLPAGMQAHLDDGSTTLAWCWRIERADGAVFGFTDHDRTLMIAGTAYEPDTGFAASEIRASADFSVDGQDAEGALRSDRITETDILDGRWDNAAIEVWRVNWENVAQRVLMRRGNLGQIRRGKQSFVAEVRSLTHFLNQPVGRTYQYYCDAKLGDTRCGVNLAAPSYSGSGSVAAVSSDRTFTTAGLGGFAVNWFALGRVEWTSGANAGRRAEVSIHGVAAGLAQITLIEAPVRAIAPGDGFFIQAGCDKQFATCRTKFGNGVNFRGFPAIPGDDTIVRYPTQGDGSSGQPL